ncbi:hypothetical protein AAC387_Pa10g0257 [Persea americana]
MEENGGDVSLNEVKGKGAKEGLVERLIENGDLYVLFYTRNWPKGIGERVCYDGCLYEGLLSPGKLSDKGKIPRPSSAIYVGYIQGSCINGYDFFIECNGESCQGQRVMNQMHGYGRKEYGNGGVHEGWWTSEVLNGHDRQAGHWTSEVMCGEGILLWASSYEYWRKLLDEVPLNSCEVLNFTNGGILCGRWKKCKIAWNCRYYPLYMSFEWLKSHVRTGVFTSDNGGKTELMGNEQRVLCLKHLDAFIDDAHSQLESTIWFFAKYGDLLVEVSIPDHVNIVLESEFSVFQDGPLDEQKRLGEVIGKGHGKYELMHVLQLGIRYCLLKNMAMPKQELPALDFSSTLRTKIRFPSDNSRHSPHEYKWKDYCPLVFRNLQELDRIDMTDYMLSICGNETLRELTSPGKSGCLLYLSHDDRFVIKTMRKSEIKVILEMLPNYYRHVKKYRNTLLTKFYGLHVVTPFGGHKVHFVVMGNILCSDLHIHKRFDLKGSSQGRCVSKVEVDERTTFKDLDLNYAFFLDPSMRNQLLKQIKQDCNFLEAEGIMDYSLLLGVHMRSTPPHGSPAGGSFNDRILTSKTSVPFNSFRREVPMHRGDDLPLCCSKGSVHKLGIKMPAHAIRVNKNAGGSVSTHRRVTAKEDYNVVLYIGIIDILQNYNMVKRMEHLYKSLQFDSQSISAVNPKAYSLRFQNFLCNVFLAKGLDVFT